MKFSLLRFMRNRDSYGHPINLYYKGDEAYQTYLGGFLTFLAQILTFVLFIGAMEEIIEMKEPIVSSFERPMLLSERKDLGPLSLSETGTVIAFEVIETVIYVQDADGKEERIWLNNTPLDPKLGRITAFLVD